MLSGLAEEYNIGNKWGKILPGCPEDRPVGLSAEKKSRQKKEVEMIGNSMESGREKSLIGSSFWGRDFSGLNRHLCRYARPGSGFRFTVALVFAVAVLGMCWAVPAHAADKLLVKDSSGTNTVFDVTDNGQVGVATSGVNVGTFGPSDVRNVAFSRNAYFDGSAWQRYDTTSYVLLDQQYGDSSEGSFQIYSAAPDANPISNWVKQFEVNTNGVTYVNSSIGIATSTPTQPLDINGNGMRIEQSMTPSSSTASCNQGQIAWDTNYVYVCVATNTWKRASLSGF